MAVDLPGSGLRRDVCDGRATRLVSKATSRTKAPRATAVNAALDKFGRLDALVSNAGIMVRKPLRSSAMPSGAGSSTPI